MSECSQTKLSTQPDTAVHKLFGQGMLSRADFWFALKQAWKEILVDGLMVFLWDPIRNRPSVWILWVNKTVKYGEQHEHKTNPLAEYEEKLNSQECSSILSGWDKQFCRHDRPLTSECKSVYMSTREWPSAVRIFGSSDSGTCSVIRLHRDWLGYQSWFPSGDCIWTPI